MSDTTTLSVDRFIEGGVYVVSIGLVLGFTDRGHVTTKGAPTIDLGGTFTGPPEFELPQQERRLTEVPFVYRVDGNVDDDAEAKARDWEAATEEKITAALAALRYDTEDFTLSRRTTL